MPIPDRHPDAVLVPNPFRGLPRERVGLYLDREFGSILELPPGKRITYRSQLNQYLVTPSADDEKVSLLFPTGHTHASAQRYDWFVVAADAGLTFLPDPEQVRSWEDRPEAVKFGWLRDVEEVPEPPLDLKTAFYRQANARAMAYHKMASRYNELKGRSKAGGEPLDQAEREELAELERDVQKLANEGPSRLTSDKD